MDSKNVLGTSQDPFEAERKAWLAVAGRGPGTDNHDPVAWKAWLDAAEATRIAWAARQMSQPNTGSD